MFALIEAYEPNFTLPQYDSDCKTWAEPHVVAVAATLEEIQKVWTARYDVDEAVRGPHSFAGILGPDGLVNYHGRRMGHIGAVGTVQVRMGIYHD